MSIRQGKIIVAGSGGGTGGTSNYIDLENKPSINGVVLEGNKTTEDLLINTGITDYNELVNKPQINEIEIQGNKTLEELNIQPADTALTTSQITNCIVSAPNNIKLELNDGTLTLKAGSKVYFGDGTSKILDNDTSITYGDKQDDLIFFVGRNDNGVYATRIPYTSSGDTAPVVNNTRRIWYDTTNKMIKMYAPNESNYSEVSLPIAMGKSSGVNNAITSIDKVFNEFSAMGSTYFLLPNVKFLFANGYNDDGSVKNIEWISDKVYSVNRTWNVNTPQKLFILYNNNSKMWFENNYFVQEEEPTIKVYTIWYKPSVRKTYYWGGLTDPQEWREYPAIYINHDLETKSEISNFDMRTSFVAFDENDFNTRFNMKMQIVNTLPTDPEADVFYFCIDA